MNNTLKIVLVLALVALLVVLGVSVLKRPKEPSVSAFPGPDILNPYLSVNGLSTFSYSSGMNQASTSLCSFRTPAATSTLVYATATFRTGTTTALLLEWGKSESPSATSTSLGVTRLGDGTLRELATFRASSTPADFAVTASAGGKDPQFVFAASNYLTLKYGGARGDLNVLAGSCKAEFKVN